MSKLILQTVCLSTFLVIIGASKPAVASEVEWQRSLLPENNRKLNEQVFASSSNNTAISLMCNNTKLRALIATENNNGAEVLSSFVEGRVKTGKNVSLIIDGEAVDTSRWLLSKKHNVFATNDRKTTVKIYRAVTESQSVSIQPKGSDPIALSLPEANDVFREFGADCGAGVNRKKQS